MTIRDVRIIKCFFEMDCDLLRSLFEIARCWDPPKGGRDECSSKDCVHARDEVVHYGGTNSSKANESHDEEPLARTRVSILQCQRLLIYVLHNASPDAALKREIKRNVSFNTGHHGLFLGLIKGSASLFFFGGRTIFD